MNIIKTFVHFLLIIFTPYLIKHINCLLLTTNKYFLLVGSFLFIFFFKDIRLHCSCTALQVNVSAGLQVINHGLVYNQHSNKGNILQAKTNISEILFLIKVLFDIIQTFSTHIHHNTVRCIQH